MASTAHRSARYLAAAFSAALALGLAPAGAESPEIGKTAVSVMGGVVTDSNFTAIFYKPWDVRAQNEYMILGAVSHEFWRPSEHLSFEAEASTGARFGDTDAFEIGAQVFLRYDGFPWNDSVYTAARLGLGPIYVSEISDIERRKSGNSGKGSRLLNGLVPEISVADPDDPNLEGFFRLHHRSGVFGLFNGVSGGSTFMTFGLRQRF